MGVVIPMSAARIHLTHGQTPYLYEDYMTALRIDELMMIDVPTANEGEKVQLLAHAVMRRTTDPLGIELVLDDSGEKRLLRRFFGSDQMPGAYNPVSMGSMAAYLSLNSEEVREVIQAGGAQYGNLTIARAVHAMKSRKISAAEALQESLSASAWVSSYQADLEAQASAVLS